MKAVRKKSTMENDEYRKRMGDESGNELAGARSEIDALDAQLIELLNRRARCAQEIGRIKARHGEGKILYRPEREAQVLRRIKEKNLGPLPDESVSRVFRELMSACLSLERPLSVAFLGPLGTFSESAVVKHFGHAAHFSPQVSIDDIFREVEAGHADFAVAPVENSTEGAIGRTLDLLMASPLKVCGEVVLRIHQHLMSREVSLESITQVYSHAQSLAQCHEWLGRALPRARRVPVGSNAQAAQLAATEAGTAALAGEAAAERYDLTILAGNVEDEPNNTTRFLVLGQQDAGPSGHDKTSLIMSAPNRTGSLYELLAPFSEAGVSMTRLESRPARHTLWEYVFYVDVEGHRDDPPVARALAELARRAAYLKVLGTYPAAVH
jgi:chorismate mutase/prephenate dehydratase